MYTIRVIFIHINDSEITCMMITKNDKIVIAVENNDKSQIIKYDSNCGNIIDHNSDKQIKYIENDEKIYCLFEHIFGFCLWYIDDSDKERKMDYSKFRIISVY